MYSVLLKRTLLCLTISFLTIEARGHKDIIRNINDAYAQDKMAASILHYMIELERLFHYEKGWGKVWFHAFPNLTTFQQLKSILTPLQSDPDRYSKLMILHGNIEDSLRKDDAKALFNDIPLILKKLDTCFLTPITKEAQDFYDVANMYPSAHDHPEITFFIDRTTNTDKDRLIHCAQAYEHGLGLINKDLNVAFLWYYCAYEDNHHDGTLQVALRLIAGMGCPQHIDRGQKMVEYLFPGKDRLPKAITGYLDPYLAKEWAFRLSLFTPLMCLDLLIRALCPAYDSQCMPFLYMICIYGLEEYLTKAKNHYSITDLMKVIDTTHDFNQVITLYYPKLTPNTVNTLLPLLATYQENLLKKRTADKKQTVPAYLAMSVSSTVPND